MAQHSNTRDKINIPEYNLPCFINVPLLTRRFAFHSGFFKLLVLSPLYVRNHYARIACVLGARTNRIQ